MATIPPQRSAAPNAGPAARRSASPEADALQPAPEGDAPGPAQPAPEGARPALPQPAPEGARPALPRPGADRPGQVPTLPGTDPPQHRRRRLGPSPLTVFLGLSAVLAWVFDAAQVVRRARRGPWRAEVAEESMAPALLPGDWLLLDPTTRRWPRAGAIVVIREPGTGILAVKRVAARGRPGGHRTSSSAVRPGGSTRPLGSREAWVLGDAAGHSIDSRAYGPLDADALVARAWLRYGPPGRIGLLR